MKQTFEIIFKMKSKWYNLDIFGFAKYSFGYVLDTLVTLTGVDQDEIDRKLWAYVDILKMRKNFNENKMDLKVYEKMDYNEL